MLEPIETRTYRCVLTTRSLRKRSCSPQQLTNVWYFPQTSLGLLLQLFSYSHRSSTKNARLQIVKYHFTI